MIYKSLAPDLTEPSPGLQCPLNIDFVEEPRFRAAARGLAATAPAAYKRVRIRPAD
jgi:hypothetical protein